MKYGTEILENKRIFDYKKIKVFSRKLGLSVLSWLQVEFTEPSTALGPGPVPGGS